MDLWPIILQNGELTISSIELGRVRISCKASVLASPATTSPTDSPETSRPTSKISPENSDPNKKQITLAIQLVLHNYNWLQSKI